MKISSTFPMRTKLLKTFVLGVTCGMMSCGLEDNLSELTPEGDASDATGGKATGGAASTNKQGNGGSKSSYAAGGRSTVAEDGSDPNTDDDNTTSGGSSDSAASSGGVKNGGKGGVGNSSNSATSIGGAKATGRGGSGNSSGSTGTKASGKGGSSNSAVSSGGTKPGGSTSTGGTKANGSGGSGNTVDGKGGATVGGKSAVGGASNGGASNGGTASGGKPATGGAPTGGKPATGGAATGGVATGGVATGGIATGGVATGGVATGGVATGGVATGGVATGGKPATGGAPTSSTPVISGSCSEGQKSLTANGTGTHCGYTYEYWKDNGTGTLTLKPDGFSVDWSNINNLLGRKGIRPGTGNEVVTYEANYQPNGNSYLCIYGWFKNPLVEYYIVDSYGTWRPPGNTGLQGTVTCDGGTYDIYKVSHTGPTIEGSSSTFNQYWSVRQQKRTSGTITVGCHFTAWKGKGMTIGSFYEVSMTVEGYQSSGKADVKFSMK